MTSNLCKHAAIIMDGNGRWAQRRGLPRWEGHRRGADAVRRAVESACRHGIETLTLYAFSSDNWKRPAEEVSALMGLLHEYLLKETETCRKEGIRLSLIGRRERLPAQLLPLIEQAEASTADGARLHLRLAVDYSSREAMFHAIRQCADPESVSRRLGPDVDLLIRTAGEQRLSDFLLWECAYAELVFLPVLWPDFDEASFVEALRQFYARQRRYGGLTPVGHPVSAEVARKLAAG